jgi:hypothetical protein
MLEAHLVNKSYISISYLSARASTALAPKKKGQKNCSTIAKAVSQSYKMDKVPARFLFFDAIIKERYRQ